MAVTRVTSYDSGYTTGNLSVYPEAIDTNYQLYEATNNSETRLSQSLTYSSSFLIVENNDHFPPNGIIRVGPPAGQTGASEMIYYDSKTQGVFRNLIRGFAGSRQNSWPINSYVSNAVFAEHHNSIKDAVIKIENNVGVQELPSPTSLNGILKAQENRYLAPRAIFRAYPTKGPPGTKIRFQNFSTGPLIRYLWDFGDGTTSVEKSPLHFYQKEGVYSVKLNIISSLGAQGISEKANYITIDQTQITPFFYTSPTSGISLQTATQLGDANLATNFSYMDQTDGNIIQRYWIFDGAGKYNGQVLENNTLSQFDPNVHYANYVYDKPGSYQPSLLILFENQKLQRVFISDRIVVE
jgi:PKD repeat protein